MNVIEQLRDSVCEERWRDAVALAFEVREPAMRQMAFAYILAHWRPERVNLGRVAGNPWIALIEAPASKEEGMMRWMLFGECVAPCRNRLQRYGVLASNGSAGTVGYWQAWFSFHGSAEYIVRWADVWPGLRPPAEFHAAVREPSTNQWCRRKDVKLAQALMHPSLLEQR